MLKINKVSLTLGKKILLDNASANIGSGYRTGLIGRNGAGKSTLMKMILGGIAPDGGSIERVVADEFVAYLEQALPQTSKNALEYTKGGDKAWQTIHSRLCAAQEQEDGLVIAECHAQLQEIDGYSLDARAAKILLGLGFSDTDMHRKVGSFSGGWQMRLQLARVLLSRAHLLLLDEPTNHLDINAIVWLEQWLKHISATVLLISHDRDFLDNVCSHTLHLSHAQLKLYSGNYTTFNQQYTLQLEQQSKQRAKIIAQREHMQKFVDRFRAKAKKARQAQSRVKALEKLTLTSGIQIDSPFHFEFLSGEPIKGAVMNFDGTAGYPNTPVLKNCRLNVSSTDRIGVIGQNGQGKTTLLKTLSGQIPLFKGNLHTHNKMKLAYFSQQQLDMLDPQSTPLQSLMRIDPKLSDSSARSFLGGFDFSNERVFEPVHIFSGGERARLALALLIYQRPNVLLLDEPTNHLDMQMREAFIMALQQFSGAVLLVSHDRYFMSSVVNEVWHVANGQVCRFSGDLDDYKQQLLSGEPKRHKPEPQKRSSQAAPVRTTTKVDYKQLKRLESRIEKITATLALLETTLQEASLYSPENKDKLHNTVIAHKQAKEKLETLEKQWLDAQE